MGVWLWTWGARVQHVLDTLRAEHGDGAVQEALDLCRTTPLTVEKAVDVVRDRMARAER